MLSLNGKSESLEFCQGDVNGFKRYNIHISGRVEHAIKWRMPFKMKKGDLSNQVEKRNISHRTRVSSGFLTCLQVNMHNTNHLTGNTRKTNNFSDKCVLNTHN